ncbi:MAG: hypothetical protein GY768_18705 [Planctomycetaceae bacterium]|nr:hypothetical protein [Planctomycetaceae bacterium]
MRFSLHSRYVVFCTAGVFLLLVVILLQWQRGNFSSEVSGPDEPSHFVTGILVREFIVSGDWSDPVGFASEFYVHYPKVGIGHWPPVFYVLQSLWTLVLPSTRVSMVLFMACLTTLAACVLYHAIRDEFDTALGIPLCLLFVLLPMVQRYSGVLMTEIPLALFCLLATLSFGKYLESGLWSDSTKFGVYSSLAILTKGSGFSLALVPLFAVLIGRRFYLFRKLSFWWSAVLVVIVCLPWYWFTRELFQDGFNQNSPVLAGVQKMGWFYAVELFAIGGPIFGLMLVIGMVVAFRRCAQSATGGVWDAVLASFFAVPVFLALTPIGPNARYLVQVIPAWVMLVALGIDFVAMRLPESLTTSQKRLVVSGCVLVLFVCVHLSIPNQHAFGFDQVAQRLLDNRDLEDAAILISSDSAGEGMFVSAVARRENRMGRIVLRSSQVLSSSGWMGYDYECLFENPNQVLKFLDSIPVSVVVFDRSVRPGPQMVHHELLLETLKRHALNWQELDSYTRMHQGIMKSDAIQVFIRDDIGSVSPPNTAMIWEMVMPQKRF